MRRAVVEGNGWLDAVQRLKSTLPDDDLAALGQLVRIWQVPVDQLRKTLAPDQNEVRVQIGVYGNGGYRSARATEAEAEGE